MAKVNFKKAEQAIDNAAQKMLIDDLSDLATIVTAIQDPNKENSEKHMNVMIVHFRKELKKLKKNNPLLYTKLHLTVEDENRLKHPPSDYTSEDWIELKKLKEKISELKKDLYGEEVFNQEDEKRVLSERQKHINKRFNVKEGWLPLH